MAKIWKIFGAEMSPYSVKVRSYFRYKGLAHAWLQRNAHEDEFAKHAKLPIIPLVLSPDNEAMQDSTPILEAMEAAHPEPACQPADARLAWVSTLLEEYGDEWGNKLMFHFRWWDEVDQRAAARALTRMSLPHAPEQWEAVSTMIFDRMTKRGHFVGSSQATAPLLEDYFNEACALWEAHLASRPYALGARPSFADFGVYPQFYELYLDPGTGGRIRGGFPNIMDYCHRMMAPRAEGEFETWDSLAPTLAPILKNIGQHFLPWTDANAKALEKNEEEFTVQLNGKPYTQPPQKYHAKSLKALREKYKTTRTPETDQLMQQNDCLDYLVA